MRLRIARWIRSDRIDVILSDTPYPLVNMPAEVSMPVIVNCHNVEHLILRRYVRSERSQLRRAYAWVECRKLERWEKQVCSDANLLFVCSEPDQSLMEKLCPGASVTVVPNTIDVDHYGPIVESDGTTLLYTGGMDWFPNRDAVEFFVAAILPELRRLNSRVKLVVAGRPGPDKFHQWLAKIPDVEFRGPVLDMRVEIARATVCVVPLRVGSGTRLKILEAAAMGKPVVSTTLGAEGLKFTQGEDILLEDRPIEFAHVVADLLMDPQRCRSLGEAARRSAEKHYGRPALSVALRVGLQKIADIVSRAVSEDTSVATEDRERA
jgi:glycosyltransferase involved in cell wall biosynthesis